MRNSLRWALRGLGIVTVLTVALVAWKQDEVARLMAVQTLFSEDRIVDNFSHMDRAFLTTEIALPDTAPEVASDPLPNINNMVLGDDVADWLIARDVTSLVILKAGDIKFENYYLGTAATDRRIGWSVSKSFLSALVGIVLDEGLIGSLDDPVTKYAPTLKGGAYEGATIRNVLQMTSGVRFDEDYLAYFSDINRMGRVLALGRSMDGFTEALTETDNSPGEAWQYVSIDTHVVGMVLRGATGKSVPDLMSEKLLDPLGLEQPPYYLTDGDGVAFTLGGLNMTTRDYARFGQLYLQNGEMDGRQIVPADWVAESTMPSAPIAIGAIGYGYQWWIPRDAEPGEFMARGIYGQYIYVNQDSGIVIAVTAADRRFRDMGVAEQNVAIFRQIVGTLRTEMVKATPAPE